MWEGCWRGGRVCVSGVRGGDEGGLGGGRRCFFFQAEDGIRDLVRSRGLGDVYKRQGNRAGRGDPPATVPQRSLAVGRPPRAGRAAGVRVGSVGRSRGASDAGLIRVEQALTRVNKVRMRPNEGAVRPIPLAPQRVDGGGAGLSWQLSRGDRPPGLSLLNTRRRRRAR